MYVTFYWSQLMTDVKTLLYSDVVVRLLFVCSGVVCVCGAQHSSGTLHISGFHLHPESLAWLVRGAGTAA
jgi:hypothetical protein